MGVHIKNADIIKLIANDLDKTKVMAHNRSVSKTIVNMKNIITGKYNIKRKDISSHIKVTKATRERVFSQIVIPHEPLGLIYFSAHQVQRGVSYSINKGGRVTRAHAFIQTVSRNSDKRQVFERYGPRVLAVKLNRAGKKPTYLRQRIRKVGAQSIAQLFIGKRGKYVLKEMQGAFIEEYNKELLRLSKYIINNKQLIKRK